VGAGNELAHIIQGHYYNRQDRDARRSNNRSEEQAHEKRAFHPPHISIQLHISI
jgi:hypothetical protein